MSSALNLNTNSHSSTLRLLVVGFHLNKYFVISIFIMRIKILDRIKWRKNNREIYVHIDIFIVDHSDICLRCIWPLTELNLSKPQQKPLKLNTVNHLNKCYSKFFSIWTTICFFLLLTTSHWIHISISMHFTLTNTNINRCTQG